MKYLLTIVLLCISSLSYSSELCDKLKNDSSLASGPLGDGYTTSKVTVLSMGETSCWIGFAYSIDEAEMIRVTAKKYEMSRHEMAKLLVSDEYGREIEKELDKVSKTLPALARKYGMEGAIFNYQYSYEIGLRPYTVIQYTYSHGKIKKSS